MLCDYHVHTGFSGDSSTPPEQQLLRAAALGMDRICITDHHDYDVNSDIDFTLDFPAYFQAMKNLQERYRRQIRVEIGVEFGLQGHIADYLNTLARTYDFDFIIGSCHFIDGQDPYFPAFYENRTAHEALERFFQVSLEMAREMDCFDSFGHLDYMARYCPVGDGEYRPSDYLEYVEPLLRTLIEKGRALECNTGGFRSRLNQPNPSGEILSLYRRLGGELITVGSDAHVPEHLGFEFGRTAELLKSCGFRYYTVYHRRQPEFLPL